ncbi:hypothetical protein [Devosia sp. SL43]|nr:hypothetical protein [Devosia sp. SL43]UJW87492.1 hypothetical protein IM737_09780 [Devosia sp. SL43]
MSPPSNRPPQPTSERAGSKNVATEAGLAVLADNIKRAIAVAGVGPIL